MTVRRPIARRLTARRLRRILVRAGRQPAAGPPPHFAAALEHRLDAIHRSLPALPAPGGRGLEAAASARPFPGLSARGWALAAGAAAVAVLVPVLALGLAGELTAAPAQVRLADATDAQFVGPGGRVEPARTGAALPDGTVIRTGVAGRATVGGQTLGPDSTAVVTGGHLRLLPAGDRPGPGPGGSGGGQAVGPPPSADQPKRGGARAASPGATPTQPSGPGPRAPAARPPEPAQPAQPQDRPLSPAPLSLAAGRVRTGGVALDWSRYSGAGFSGYAVLRTTGNSGPRYPRDAIRFTGDRGDTAFSDRGAPGSALRYRVVAFDEQGRVVAASETVVVSPA